MDLLKLIKSLLLSFSLFVWTEKLIAIPQPYQKPLITIENPFSSYTLINSIDFHPKKNLFCTTFTHQNSIALYAILPAGSAKITQIIKNPKGALAEPQHAVFSPNGEFIAVTNWSNETLALYKKKGGSLYREKPSLLVPFPSPLTSYKPHGLSFSPCGSYLAIAFGATSLHGRAIALLEVDYSTLQIKLSAILKENDLPGIPKGITFSPDGRALLVTYCDVNTLHIYSLSNDKREIIKKPLQVIQGKKTKISRPEDVKLTADYSYCAISNSSGDSIAFFSFDKEKNRITKKTPSYILANPAADFHFPHGIAFSYDGSFLGVSTFGLVSEGSTGNIVWDDTTDPREAKIHIYQKQF